MHTRNPHGSDVSTFLALAYTPICVFACISAIILYNHCICIKVVTAVTEVSEAPYLQAIAGGQVVSDTSETDDKIVPAAL